MPDYKKEVVGPLLRRRAHLKEVGADPAKLAELDHQLRMAGYPADDDSPLRGGKRMEHEKPGVPRAEDEVPPTTHDGHMETGQDDELKKDEQVEPKAEPKSDTPLDTMAKHLPPKERSAQPVSTAKGPEVKPTISNVNSKFLSGEQK